MDTIIVGYGNVDRQDDGAAWHVLCKLARALGRDVPDYPDLFTNPQDHPIHLHFDLQLTPELGELLHQFDRACFIDAHTGAILEDIRISTVEPVYKQSPLTHHMSPGSCLSVTKKIYGRIPQAILLSIRGYEFEFKPFLSPRTAKLVAEAANRVMDWLQATG